MRPSARVVGATVASLGVHAVLMLVMAELAQAPARMQDPIASSSDAVEVKITFPPEWSWPTQAIGSPPVLSGGKQSQGVLDQDAAPGQGGSGAPEDGALLFPSASSITLQDTDLNNLRRNQTQRIRTASDRATQEQRRASPNAADEVFLSSGQRGHAERRRADTRDAARGAPEGGRPLVAGTPQAAGEHRAPVQPSSSGSAPRDHTGQGILRGRGERHTDAARVAFARPNVDPGPAATPAEQLDARIRDNVNAELLAARLQRSLVDSSVQRGAKAQGGAGGDSRPGDGLDAHGLGTGARALPYTPGPGRDGALDTGDARYLRWFTAQRARVQDALRFPRARALAKDQGMSVYRIEVGRDGKLRSAPTLLRSSGFEDFDAAAVTAIQQAAPFEPLPAALAPELDRLSLVIPVAFSNPMVN